jgi:Mycothiol maleylpyruvate isomerase N-terminal domain
MGLMLTDSRVHANQEALWNALDMFFDGLSAEDWGRKHGKHWTFADVPYHLAYFNRLVADAIKRGARSSEEDALSTLDELNAWNNEQFSQRPAAYTPEQAVGEMRDSQLYLRRAARESSSDSPVWLPLLTVRGWRNTRFAVAYNYWHTWLHFTEAYLRRYDALPPLDTPLLKRGLDFHMEITSKAINRDAALHEQLIWTLTLTGAGGGQWTFVLKNGECHVVYGESSRADVMMTTDIMTYLKTSAFGIQSPLLATVMGKIKVRGLGSVGKLRKLFAPTSQQVWQPIEQTTATRQTQFEG